MAGISPRAKATADTDKAPLGMLQSGLPLRPAVHTFLPQIEICGKRKNRSPYLGAREDAHSHTAACADALLGAADDQTFVVESEQSHRSFRLEGQQLLFRTVFGGR